MRRSWKWVAALVAGGALGAPGACAGVAEDAPGESEFACLSPPPLTTPLTFDGQCPGDGGLPSQVRAGGRDVFVRLPADRVCQRALHVSEAGNVWILGGTFVYNDSAPAVISISRSAGTSFVEGLSIDVAGRPADAIRVFRHTGRLIVQNTFARRIGGQPAGVHGDLVHAQGGGPLEELILQNVTGYTGYQGLFAPYRPGSGHGTRALRLERVNVGYDATLGRAAGAGKPLMLLFMGSADDPADRPPDRGTVLSAVYADASFWNQPHFRYVYPAPRASLGRCTAFGGQHGITGSVCDGPPADGDFAPEAAVGKGYVREALCGAGPRAGGAMAAAPDEPADEDEAAAGPEPSRASTAAVFDPVAMGWWR